MFSILVSAVLLSNVVSTHIAQSDSLIRARDAQSDRVEERRTTVDEYRVKRQEAIDSIRNNREEFKARLSEIRDEKKRNIVENLASRFDSVNAKWTEHWNSTLARLAEVLTKIEARSDEVDTSEAQTAISRAQEEVNTQAAKVYEIEFDPEEELGPQIKALIAEFHSDLRSTQETVQIAREEVQKAFRQLKALGGNDDE